MKTMRTHQDLSWVKLVSLSVLLILLFPACDAGFERICRLRDYSAPQGRCGDDLWLIIDMVCDGKFYYPSVEQKGKPHKRSQASSVDGLDMTSEERDLVTKRSIGRLLRSRYRNNKSLARHIDRKLVATTPPLDPTHTPRMTSSTKPPPDDDKVFISKERANSFLTSRRPKPKRQYSDGMDFLIPSSRQGIVCECCVNNCAMFELQQYCADSSIDY